MISIVVPVYNVEKYLEKCLNSLVNQTYKDLEIICVNDGSPDNCLDILNRFASIDERVKVISQENAGVSAARNSGLKIATGEYIGFVDPDDWLDLDFYEKLYNAIKKYDADIAVGGIKRVREVGFKYHLKIKEEECTDDVERKFLICDVPDKCYVWNKIYRSSKLKEIGLKFEDGVYYEDRCFTAQALVKMGRLVVVPDTYYNYWTNRNSIVKVKSPKKLKDARETKEKMFEFLKENNVKIDHYPYKMQKFKRFGLTLFKINYYNNKKELVLFNHLKLRIG